MAWAGTVVCVTEVVIIVCEEEVIIGAARRGYAIPTGVFVVACETSPLCKRLMDSPPFDFIKHPLVAV